MLSKMKVKKDEYLDKYTTDDPVKIIKFPETARFSELDLGGEDDEAMSN